MITLTNILLSSAILILLFFVFNLLRKLEKQEDIILELEDEKEQSDKWILSFQDKITDSFLQMKEIDIRGAFESEDEVGTVFKQLLEIIQELKEITSIDESETN